MSIGRLYVLFGEVSIQVLCPIFDWVVCFFGVEFFFLIFIVIQLQLYGVEFYKYIIDLGYQLLIRDIGEYVLPFRGMTFYFVDDFLCCEVFEFLNNKYVTLNIKQQQKVLQ